MLKQGQKVSINVTEDPSRERHNGKMGTVVKDLGLIVVVVLEIDMLRGFFRDEVQPFLTREILEERWS